MPLPTLPLPTNIIPGEPNHADLHNDVNAAANYLVSDSQTANLVFASPDGAPGAADFRALGLADLPALYSRETAYMGNNGSTLGAGGTVYFTKGINAGNASEAVRQMRILAACVISNLYIVIESAQPGTGSLVLTCRKNGVDTTLEVTIAAGSPGATYSDTTHSVAFAVGDLLSFRLKNNASSATPNIDTMPFLITTPLSAVSP